MASKPKLAVPFRPGIPLKIVREWVAFGRYPVTTAPKFELQHRLFVNDPWAVIAEAIHRALPEGRTRDVAHSFRRQAEDYFRAANTGHELAVRPVLLYYACLNLAKAYTVAKGNPGLAGRTSHGVSTPPSRPRQIQGALLKFEKAAASRPAVFQQLLKDLAGNPAILKSDLRLGHLLSQILPGHRLWCYAAKRRERFVPIEKIDVCQAPKDSQVWINMYLNRDDLDRLDLSESTVLSEGELSTDFELANDPTRADLVCFQLRNPETYIADPGEALLGIVQRVKNAIWETVKVASPYRKPYIYCAPPAERPARLP